MLKERPAFCASIGNCIAIWTHVDSEMGNLFGVLLGTDSEAALEVFLTLRRSSNQREALQAAAKFALSGNELIAFQSIFSIYKYLEIQRNDLAHGCFGICPEDSSILFWIEVKHHVHFQMEVLSRESKGHFALDRHARLKDHMFVYRDKDLQVLYDEMEQFWWTIFYFNGYLRDPNNTGRKDEFTRICDFPRMRNEMSLLHLKK